MSTFIFKKTVTLTAKVLYDLTIGAQSTPKLIGEATGRTKHLHRNRIGGWFGLANFRGKQVVGIAGVIQDQALLFLLGQAQTAADDLLIQGEGFGRPQHDDEIDMGRIKPRG